MQNGRGREEGEGKGGGLQGRQNGSARESA